MSRKLSFLKERKSKKRNVVIEIKPEASDNLWPIVYTNSYNVSFCGLEKMHPFDARKWGNIFKYLTEYLPICETNIVHPEEITREILRLVHTERYINSLKWGWNVAAIAEIPLLALLPNAIIQQCYLKPMRFQTQGSILAGKLALENGWALNIGGGFHHCSSNEGGGFCVYADITLLIEYLFKFHSDRAKKIMIVDLDAHQGNGYAKDFMGNEKVFIMDVYNGDIYPHDTKAKKAIRCRVELGSYVMDSEYLDAVESHLETSLAKFHPDLVVFNAGTDIMNGDSLGRLSVSPRGIIKRDEIVFMKARERRVPIVMLTSGGYLKESAKVIADSINNLYDVGLISPSN